MQQKIRKKFSVFYITPFEWVTAKLHFTLKLTKSPKSSHVTNRDIFHFNFSQSNEKYDKSVAMQI